jgi:hypothetical protein
MQVLIDYSNDRVGLIRELVALEARCLAEAGEIHLTTSTITGNIGQSYDFMRRPVQAAAYYKRCLKVRRIHCMQSPFSLPLSTFVALMR